MGTSRRIDISGCYIVKDEADVIAASLAAIAPFVDETVVYDTGSSDDTVAIARAAGARVIEGYWDEDFGAARNRAAEHCRGEWILNVDADEVPEGDPRAFRRHLRYSPTKDVFTVTQVSPSWEGTSAVMDVRVGRVLRRATARWNGALHEQIVGVRGQLLHRDELDLKLVHSGYTLVRSQEKGKGERNYRVARQELDQDLAAGSENVNRSRINFGRSAHLAGHLEEALAAYESIDLSSVSPPEQAVAAHGAVFVATKLEQFEVVERWMLRLGALREDPSILRWLQVQVHAQRHEWHEVLQLVQRLTDAVDLRGVQFSPVAAQPFMVDALVHLGELDRAADVVVRHLRGGLMDMSASGIVQVFVMAGRDMGELVDALPKALTVPLLGQVQAMPYSSVSGLLEALWARDRSRPGVLLTASAAWAELPVHDALSWSLRLREAGLVQYCPLRRRFSQPGDLRGRILAGVALAEVGEDVWGGLEQLLAHVPDADAGAVVAEVATVSPRIAAALQPV